MGRVKGYEIHMGETERDGDDEAFFGEGAVSPDGMVIGTYLHGLFDNRSAVHALLSFLYARKGLVFDPGPPGESRDVYEELAAGFEQHIRLDPIIALFGD
jgi:adenosylcobyric acid synthase